MIHASQKPMSGILSSILGILTLLIGATGALVELKDGLNRIWRVKPTETSLKGLAKKYLTSLGLIWGIAFLLLVSLVISAGLSAFSTLVSHQAPFLKAIWHAVDLIFSWAVITGLFAAIFKTLPDVSIRWNDVWIGGAFTGALFTVGKVLIGLYIGKSALTSTYGAAGSLVAIVMWVYYSSLILYFGAEFTRAYATHYGSHKAA